MVWHAARHAPLPVALLVLSFLSPTELSLDVAGFRLPPHRLAILALIGPAVWRLIARTDIRIHAFDVLFLVYGGWTMIVSHLHGPAHGSLFFGGSLALEAFGGYVIARAYVRDHAAFQATLSVLVLAIGIAAVIALPETLMGRHFTHDFLQSVTGYAHPREIEYRLGFTRAYGVFDHPIHLGTFATTVLAMVWFNGRGLLKRLKAIAVIGVTAFAAMSSAPILCAVMQVGLIGWDQLTRRIGGRLLLTGLALLIVYIAIDLFASRSPAMLIATGFTINPWTGFYRIQIWEWGMRSVANHPWIGIGLAEWERAWWMYSASIDAYWLLIAVRDGIPALALLLAALLSLVVTVALRTHRTRDKNRSRSAKAWLMSMLAISLVACTVHFWTVTHAYLFFVFGLGAWLADPRPRRKRQRRMRAATEARTRTTAAVETDGNAETPVTAPPHRAHRRAPVA